MKHLNLLSATALTSIALATPGLAWASAAPVAQDSSAQTCPPVTAGTAGDVNCTPTTGDPTQSSDGSDNGGGEAIVITGSRIRSPNATSALPVTSLGGESIFQTGDTNVGEQLNDLPQLRSTFAQQNPGLGIGIAGLNLLDLRGLGTARTLVLVNGRRHVAADILNNAVSPDVSSIPNDLIERVDIVTGGNSAVYGSDAIAGVVNFVLRRSYEGLQLRGQAGVAEAGYGANQYVSAMYGHNFASGRGNITLHGEYNRQERVFASDIPNFRQQNGLFTVDTDSSLGGTLVDGSDGYPDAIFLRDVRSGTIDYRGLVPINQRAIGSSTTGYAASGCGNATLANFGPTNSNGLPFSCAYIFDGGRLTQQTGARFGTGINASRLGGNGQTGREGQTISVLPYLERYNFNLLTHYEIAPALELFAEVKWNRVNAVGNNAGPSFIQTGSGNTGNVGDSRERIRLDNPFLDPGDRATLANLILASNCNPSLTVTCPATTNIGTAAAPNIILGNLTPTDRTNIANGSYRFILARNLLDAGLRDERFRRDTFRAVAGLRGTFNGDWSYEISGNYGRFDQYETTAGYIDRQRFSLSFDAGRNPATGAIQCRSQFDAASAFAIQRAGAGDPAANTARLAADIAACQPYNPFGTADNSAAVNYFTRTVTAKASLEQIDAMAFVSGDSSQLFELPGGPVRFAIGGEYRRERARYEQDAFAVQGFTNAVTIPLFNPPAFEVKEGYAELQVPILHDVPFFQDLSLSGAARVSSYNGSTGTVWAYNGGVQWSPVRDIRFRANYARAVRAPNVSETGFPLVPNFSSISDPCNSANIGQNETRRTNCNATVGAANVGNLPTGTYSLGIVSGSNPSLVAETSDSYTLGVVLQPHWVRGFVLTVDYYNIKVNGIISSVTAQTILNNCVDLPTTSNIYCAQFQRNTTGSALATGEQPGQIINNTLIVAPLNFANRVREGIDFNLQYSTRLTNAVSMSANLIYTHGLTSSNFEDPTNPNFENRILGELGDPKDEFRFDFDIGTRNVTFGYRLHFIGPMYTSTYEAFNSLNGGVGLNRDAISPERYPVITYSDFRLEFNVNGNGARDTGLRFYVGVDNAFNQLPPLGTTATGAGSAIYDFRGRNFYAGVRARY